MTHIRKLKSASPIYSFVPAIFALAVFAFTALLLGRIIGLKVLGSIMLIYAILSIGIFYQKTKSYVYLVSSSYLLVFGIVLLTMQMQYDGDPWRVFPPLTRFFGIWMVILWIWLVYLMTTNQTRWKGANILELAAIGAENSDNAYTERPFPVSRIDYDKEEINALASHLKKNLVCSAYRDNGKIYLVPLNNREAFDLILQPAFNIIEKTWISFDAEGQVAVHISRKSYLSFTENLALDQLCSNLGNLFIEFLDDYRKGESTRILDKIQSVKTNFFA